MTIQEEINTNLKKIDELNRDIERLKHEQNRCFHSWSAPRFNPYVVVKSAPIPGAYDRQGIHMTPKMTTYNVDAPRWTRTCATCGKEQHTETQRPTTVEPYFGG